MPHVIAPDTDLASQINDLLQDEYALTQSISNLEKELDVQKKKLEEVIELKAQAQVRKNHLDKCHLMMKQILAGLTQLPLKIGEQFLEEMERMRGNIYGKLNLLEKAKSPVQPVANKVPELSPPAVVSEIPLANSKPPVLNPAELAGSV